MSSWISNMRGFGRASNKTPNAPKQGNGTSPTSNGPPSSLTPSSSSNLATSPVMTPTSNIDNPMNNQENFSQNLQQTTSLNRKPPFFFREQYANLIVKGNFMTLAATPVLVEEGEWLAHQVVEQNRLLDGMLKIIQEQDRTTGLPICNTNTCQSMTAGPNTNYTWLDNQKNAVRVPAPQYIAYVQRWITGKVADPSIFPTDTFTSAPPSLTAQQSNSSNSLNASTDTWIGKPSGFPSNFPNEIRNIYRQMFRCYAHIYHAHWLEFWHLGAYKELNTCFIHFVNVGRLFALLGDKDLEPMGPLIDIWLEKGWLPRPSSSHGAKSTTSNGAKDGSGIASNDSNVLVGTASSGPSTN